MVTEIVLGATLDPVAFLGCFVALAHDIFNSWLIYRVDFFFIFAADVTNFDRPIFHAGASDIEVGVVLEHLQVVAGFTIPQTGLVPVVLVFDLVKPALHSPRRTRNQRKRLIVRWTLLPATLGIRT